ERPEAQRYRNAEDQEHKTRRLRRPAMMLLGHGHLRVGNVAVQMAVHLAMRLPREVVFVGVIVMGNGREITQADLAEDGRVGTRIPPREVRESRVVIWDDARWDRTRRVGRERERARLAV